MNTKNNEIKPEVDSKNLPTSIDQLNNPTSTPHKTRRKTKNSHNVSSTSSISEIETLEGEEIKNATPSEISTETKRTTELTDENLEDVSPKFSDTQSDKKKFDIFKDLRSKNQSKTSVVLPYLIVLMPLISGVLVTLFELIFSSPLWPFHMSYLPIILTAAVFLCCFLPFDIYYIIKKKWKPFKVFTKHIFKNRLECFLLITSFLWMIFTSFFTNNFPTNFKFFLDYDNGTYLQECVLFFVVYLAILISTITLKDRPVKEHLLGVFLASTSIMCVLTLFFHHSELAVSFLNNTNWAYAFVNSNHFGYVLCLATSLIAVCFCLSKQLKTRIMFGIVLALHLFVAMFNDTLGSNLALFFGFCLLPIIISIKNRKFDILSFTPLIMLTAINFICIPLARPMDSTYSSLYMQISGVFKDSFKVSSAPLAEETKKAGTNRWELWLDAFEQISKYPIFGDGEMIAKPHNEYLQFAAHSGILSAVLYISGLVIIAVKGIKYFKHISNLSICLLFCVMCYAISAFFGNTMPHTYPFFMVILGLCISTLNLDIDKYKQQNRTTQGIEKTFGFNESENPIK